MICTAGKWRDGASTDVRVSPAASLALKEHVTPQRGFRSLIALLTLECGLVGCFPIGKDAYYPSHPEIPPDL
jgi:hypothetical protein